MTSRIDITRYLGSGLGRAMFALSSEVASKIEAHGVGDVLANAFVELKRKSPRQIDVRDFIGGAALRPGDEIPKHEPRKDHRQR